MKIAIFDLENTISNAYHRMSFLKMMNKSDVYKHELSLIFQSGFQDDKVNLNIKMFMESLMHKGYKIVILTEKLDSYREMVFEWLNKNHILYHELIMKYSDAEVDFKEKYVIENLNDIAFAFDDVGKNCAMFQRYNIPCLRIEQKLK